MCPNRITRVLLVLAAIAPTAAPMAVADSVTLTPIRDNTLFEDPNGGLSNGAGAALFAGRSGTGLIRRALLRFDIAGAVPSKARVDSVTLAMTVAMAPNEVPHTMTLHRVSEDWGEGTSSTTSGGGAAATPGDATWMHTFYPGAFWSAPGGDFDPSPSASAPVAGIGTYFWSADGMRSDAQGWLDLPGSNDGWVLIGDESSPTTARRFDSREATTAANRPALTVYYSVGITSAVRASWGGLKTRYR